MPNNRCSVPKCKNKHGSNTSISLFRVTAKRYNKWLNKIPIALKINDVICEEHFTPECVSREWKAPNSTIIIPLKKAKLSDDAIPFTSSNNPSESNKKETTVEVSNTCNKDLTTINASSPSKSNKIETEVEVSNTCNKDLTTTNIYLSGKNPSKSNKKGTEVEVSNTCDKDLTTTNIILSRINPSKSNKKETEVEVSNTNKDLTTTIISDENLFQIESIEDEICFENIKLPSTNWTFCKLLIDSAEIKVFSETIYSKYSQNVFIARKLTICDSDIKMFYGDKQVCQNLLEYRVPSTNETEFQELLNTFSSFKLCVMGPRINKFNKDFKIRTGWKDFRSSTWRHNKCAIFLTDINYCQYCCSLESTLNHSTKRTDNNIILDYRKKLAQKQRIIRRLETKNKFMESQLNELNHKYNTLNQSEI